MVKHNLFGLCVLVLLVLTTKHSHAFKGFHPQCRRFEDSGGIANEHPNDAPLDRVNLTKILTNKNFEHFARSEVHFLEQSTPDSQSSRRYVYGDYYVTFMLVDRLTANKDFSSTRVLIAQFEKADEHGPVERELLVLSITDLAPGGDSVSFNIDSKSIETSTKDLPDTLITDENSVFLVHKTIDDKLKIKCAGVEKTFSSRGVTAFKIHNPPAVHTFPRNPANSSIALKYSQSHRTFKNLADLRNESKIKLVENYGDAIGN